ncbi:MAG: type II toxin-antitoxin system prevent-host-death family antitoxin [bacterium]|nr:type II toxin-antitoxin system prevent-host-death family antitoxin [Candidatus Wildermuthbacteria bacterium]MDP2664908.1 type II toxin-antitoxin system prevent-host-death family antitoxin [bacterium]
MDLNEIKELLGNGGGKIVVVENGKPTMVILSYAEYKSANAGTQALKSENEPSNFESQASEELTVDDLPL